MENQNVDKYLGQLVAKSIKDPDLPPIYRRWKGHLTNLKIPPFLILMNHHHTKSEPVKLIAMMVMMTTIGKFSFE